MPQNNRNTLFLRDQTLTLSEFKLKSKSISGEPLERIPDEIRPILDPTNRNSDNSIFIDSHSHSFTLDHIPNNFKNLLRYFPRNLQKRFLDRLYKITANTFLGFLKRKKSVHIINALVKRYVPLLPQHIGTSKNSIFIVNLMMDMERGIGGRANKPYIEQLEEIIGVRNNDITFIESNDHDYQNMVLPFLAVDPHNIDIYKQFLAVFAPNKFSFSETNHLKIEHSFIGVKLYPPLGYTPYDPTLIPIYEVCEQKNIPIITHIGGYRTKTEFEYVELADQKYNATTNEFELGTKKAVKIFKEEVGQGRTYLVKEIFIQPYRWENVFKKFNKLKVCLAHMGDNDEWRRYREIIKEVGTPFTSQNIDTIRIPDSLTSKVISNHVFQCLMLMNKYDQVYVDISYTFVFKENMKVILKLMKDDVFGKKIMYGSDFYMTEVEKDGRSGQRPEVTLHEVFRGHKNEWERLTSINARNFLFRKTEG